MITDTQYLDFLDALLQGDKARCSKIANSAFSAGVEIKDIYLGLFQRSLQFIGKQWEMNRLSIAEEHLSTQIVDLLISELHMKLPACTDCGRKVVIACVEKEFHTIGAKMAANIFESHGWRTSFLGVNLPKEEFLRAIRLIQPDMLGISISLYLNELRFLKLLEAVVREFPSLGVVVGGSGISEKLRKGLAKSFPGVRYFKSIGHLDVYLAGLIDKKTN